MIVRNSVILVDQIEVEKAAGRGGWDAVVEASLVRFRPIILTAQAMILGMAPIAYRNGICIPLSTTPRGSRFRDIFAVGVRKCV